MSHLKERAEKNCLNCNAVLEGRFCHICGQQNIEPKETVWHLISHFFQDITHFDGKFFSTVKYLITKPGFLSREYMLGRRASYLNPIRMYVFTSAFFFLIFFNFYQHKAVSANDNTSKSILKSLTNAQKALMEELKDEDISQAEKDASKSKLNDVLSDIAILQKDSTAVDKLKTHQQSLNITFGNEEDKKYKTLKQYDSLQKILPPKEKDGFLKNAFERRNLFLKEKYHNSGAAIIESIKEDFIHRFPQMLFVSLPLFALLLKLLYIRRKNFYYVSHGIYAIHLYAGTFIFILVGMWLGSILSWFNLEIPTWLKTALTFGVIFFWYKSQRNFYQQRRAKTVFKFILLMFFSLLLISLVFVIFSIFSIFSI